MASCGWFTCIIQQFKGVNFKQCEKFCLQGYHCLPINCVLKCVFLDDAGAEVEEEAGMNAERPPCGWKVWKINKLLLAFLFRGFMCVHLWIWNINVYLGYYINVCFRKYGLESWCWLLMHCDGLVDGCWLINTGMCYGVYETDRRQHQFQGAILTLLLDIRGFGNKLKNMQFYV